MIPVIPFDPSKDYTGPALASAGQSIAQGIVGFGQNAHAVKTQKANASRQESQFDDEMKFKRQAARVAQMDGDLDEVRRQEDILRNSGTPPEEIAAWGQKQRDEIRRKYGWEAFEPGEGLEAGPAKAPGAPQPAPAASPAPAPLDLSVDDDPLAGGGAPAAAPKPAPSRLAGPGMFTAKSEDVSLETDAFSGAPAAPSPTMVSAPEAQPAADLSVDDDPLAGGTKPAAPPAAPAAPLDFAGLLAKGQERKAEQKREEKESAFHERELTGLSANGWEGWRSKIPGAENLDPNASLSQARQARGLLEAYLKQMQLAQSERNARLANGRNAYEDESQLRREFQGVAKIYEDRIREGADIDQLASQANNPSDFAMMQKFARMMSPGIVTDKEVAAMARPGGALESFAAEWNRLVNKQTLLPEQRARIVAAVKELERNARTNLEATATQYRDLATSYKFNPDNVASSTFLAPKAPPAAAPKGEVY